MAWPNATDFIEAVQDLPASMEDEELQAGEVQRTPLGLPLLWSGNFADVFKIHCPATGNSWALKCFSREVSGQRDRYRCIAADLEQAQLPFTVDFRYLEHGIRIGDRWFPALKMRWVEGLTLAEFVEEHLDRPGNLKMLLDLWVKLAARLREAEVAHADLQHGNVLLVPMSGRSLALRLIDYDGMYVPSLAGTRSGEVGHPAYQHPQRLREGTYNAEVDRFSLLSIYCAIRCLMVGRRELWQRFNNGDNLLFREADFAAPSQSPPLGALWQSADQEVRALVGRLALACGQRLEEVPWIDELVAMGPVQPLTRKEERQVAQMLSAGQAAAAPVPPLPLGEGRGEGGAATWRAEPPMLPLERVGPATATAETRPPAAEGKMPAIHALGSRARALAKSLVGWALAHHQGGRLRALGKPLWGGIAAASRSFDAILRRLVGEENNRLRYFLWATLPLLLLAAIWRGYGFLQGGPFLRFQPLSPQTVEAGNRLSVTPTIAWQPRRIPGFICHLGPQYSLGPESPAGSAINAATGELTWTPPWDQAAGRYQVTVRAQTWDGQTAQTILVVTVTKPILTPATLPHKEISVDLGNGVKLQMVLIPAGEFLMGSPASDMSAGIDEKPQHRVRITRPFYLGKYLVTPGATGSASASGGLSFGRVAGAKAKTRSQDGRVGRVQPAAPGVKYASAG